MGSTQRSSDRRGAGRAEQRRRRRRLPAFAALAVLLSLSVFIALARADSGQLTITQCSEGQACQDSGTTLTPVPRSSQRSTSPQSSAGGEVHTYSLRTGKGQVQTPEGAKQKDTAKVELSPSVQDALRHHDRRRSPQAGAPVRPPVSTNGGAGIAPSPSGSVPFTPPFASLSSDQALAQFAVPPFLMPVYVAAGRAYGVPWNVLAAINQIETDFGRNLNVSSAGAVGWMQFMPATWRTWGVDASGDGYADPYNPVDAIYAAARYLRGSGAGGDLSRAILAYNHADWYVAEVLKIAGTYGSLPSGLVNATSTLAYGRFPLLGRATYGDDFRAAQAAGKRPRGLSIQGARGATAVATQEATVERVMLDPPLAADLRRQGSLASLGGSVAGYAPATTAPPDVAGVVAAVTRVAAIAAGRPQVAALTTTAHAAGRPSSSALPAGYGVTSTPGITVVVQDAAGDRYSYGGLAALRDDVRPGAKMKAGQAIGSLPPGSNATLLFSVAAAGGAPVDPRPLVDGYRLQEATDLYNAVQPLGVSPFVPSSRASLAGGHYVFPLPSSVHWTPGRVDMGWDIETGTTGVGQPLLAIGNAQILHIQSMGAFGPTWISYRLLDGPAAGRTVFIGHAGPPLVQAGETVRAGDPIIRIHGGSYGGPPGHFEIGWANPDGTNTLAAPHYSEGDVTREGASFQSFVSQLPGTLGGVAFPGGLGRLKPEKVTAAQELKLSRELDKIANPRVAHKPSPAAVRVSRSRPPTPAPTSAVSVTPTAAGARVISVAVPQSGHAGDAWAIGTIDGSTRPGWAESQVVVLAYHGGSWQLAGPPRDEHGHVVNPSLRSLAVAPGGGYAVGDHGSVVAFGRGAPRALPAATKAPLYAVSAARRGGQLTALAVGGRGEVVRVEGTRVTSERRVAGHPTLRAVTLSSDGSALIAGSPASGGRSLYTDGGGGPAPTNADFHLPHGTGVELGAIAAGSRDLWVAGAVSDSGAGAPRPFVAHRDAHGWRTFCSTGGAPAGVVELGRSSRSACDAALPSGAASGAASSLAFTGAGTLVATPAGVELYDGQNFRPLRRSLPEPKSPTASISLAVDPSGCGWAVSGNREIGRIAPAGACSRTATVSKAPVVRLSQPGASTPAAVAVRPGGGRALAVAGQRAAVVAGAAPEALRGPGVPVRDAALTGTSQGWAVADSGQLLADRAGSWSVAGGQAAGLQSLLAVRKALGATALTPAGDAGATAGFSALAFRSPDDGYAVGGHGLIAHYDGKTWSAQSGPTGVDLRDVAAGPGGVVVVGDHGTLLERDGDSWNGSEKASSLVGGQDFTAAAALADGTLLAAAGGSLIERPGDGSWRPAPIAPLGVSATKLAGYRDRGGTLHALALVQTGGGVSLLDGDGRGWQPVAMPTGLSLSDFAVDESARRLWVAGNDGRGAATVALGLPADTSPRQTASLFDSLLKGFHL